ncbi:phosphoglycolate phosphatase [Marilutibacter alkalisoli]|uniref:Phosphoglycolate phosphatase n=1 Tax=Marilutibacter alkalisoli TaxID=2591633 RepID=A0A514BTR8_9GAMM|nr:phosphoglycolate phosphatase [Lysobacter alkalisoli]QDH70419.1 phosphoglycolate phosphatase [Lysobacter alkalisoli]
MSPVFPKAALFDLDGTLADSVHDLLAAANAMLEADGRAPMTLAGFRPHVSRGARAMLQAAFPDLAEDERLSRVPAFLDHYQREIGRHGGVFDGVEAMLGALEAAGTVWGIVTNKPEHLARELLPHLGWAERCAVLVGGDTLPERKPHPLPLLHAAKAIGVDPADCVYVGDDERDIVAAHAAGMRSVVALWGYRLPDDRPRDWGGDTLIEQPVELADRGRWPQR